VIRPYGAVKPGLSIKQYDVPLAEWPYTTPLLSPVNRVQIDMDTPEDYHRICEAIEIKKQKEKVDLT
jgi:hypothetical protein